MPPSPPSFSDLSGKLAVSHPLRTQFLYSIISSYTEWRKLCLPFIQYPMSLMLFTPRTIALPRVLPLHSFSTIPKALWHVFAHGLSSITKRLGWCFLGLVKFMADDLSLVIYQIRISLRSILRHIPMFGFSRGRLYSKGNWVGIEWGSIQPTNIRSSCLTLLGLHSLRLVRHTCKHLPSFAKTKCHVTMSHILTIFSFHPSLQ